MRREDLKTILYVDDEPDIREVVQMSLSLVDGLDVQTCESGERALEVVLRWRPDLLLLDVMMPGMDGPSTLQELRTMAGFETLPVIFITAKAMPQEVARFRELGAVAVIAKPFDPIKLGHQVIAAWEELADG